MTALPRSQGPLLAALAILLALAAYWPSLGGDFLWDDDLWLQKSEITQAPDGWLRAWGGENWDYYPLTSTAFWLQWRAFGENATGYRTVNVGLHALAAFLLFRLLRRLAVPGAAIGAALFLLHPAAVGSVAWITEIKNTLSLALALGAALAWLDDADGRSRWPLALFLFAAAALTKATVVVVPVLLLGLTRMQRGTVATRDYVRAIPFFAVAGAVAIAAFWFQANRAVGNAELAPLEPMARFALAGRAFAFYAAQALAPVNLDIIHERWDPAGVGAAWALFLFVLPALAGLAYARRQIGIAVALLAYVLFLLPTAGFFDLYYSIYSYVADHWHYHALAAAAALIGAAIGRLPRPAALGAGALLAALAFAGTFAQAKHYASPLAMWTHVHAANPDAWVARNGLGVQWGRQGDNDRAIAHFEAAVAARPNYAMAWDNLGLARQRQGDAAGAEEAFRAALDARPDYMGPRLNLARALVQQRRFPEAVAELETVRERYPDRPEVSLDLAVAMTESGSPDAGLAELDATLARYPAYTEAHYLKARLLVRAQRLEEAATSVRRVLELQPDHPEAPEVLRALEQALAGGGASGSPR